MIYLSLYENFDWSLNDVIDKLHLKNYVIDSDGTINVYDKDSEDNDHVSVNLFKLFFSEKVVELPVKFGKISGSFQANQMGLQSLKGFPKEVFGNLQIDHNRLTSLHGCTSFVRGNFYCNSNEYYDNQKNYRLRSLIGGPETVGGDYNFGNNGVYDFEGFPKDYNFVQNDIHSEGNPVYSIVSNIHSRSERTQTNFIKYLIEFDVIRGKTVVRDRFEEAYKVYTGYQWDRKQYKTSKYGYKLI